MSGTEQHAQAYDPNDAVMVALGISATHVEPGHAVLTMTVGARHCDHRGVLDRGTAFTLADAAIALASNAYGPLALLVHADVQWMADAAVGEALTATCAVVHHDAAGASFRSSVTAADGTLIGVVWGTTRTPRR